MAEVITECVCGQLPELEPLQRLCEACDAEPGEACAPDCIGRAAHLDEIAGGDLCARHGGPWGSDPTCADCTDLDGAPLPCEEPCSCERSFPAHDFPAVCGNCGYRLSAAPQ